VKNGKRPTRREEFRPHLKQHAVKTRLREKGAKRGGHKQKKAAKKKIPNQGGGNLGKKGGLGEAQDTVREGGGGDNLLSGRNRR